MTDRSFEAPVLRADGKVELHQHRIRSRGEGFVVERPELPDLELGPGYRLLETRSCGVCATDLARPFLPFPLPQIVGHELLVVDEEGRRFAVEINASCLARRLPELCDLCHAGMPTHCSRRLTVGINELPGGFGPLVLAPVGALVPVPDEVDDDTAILLEPLAAALHAVDSCGIEEGDTVAVLGPRRLGMLVIAALAARRREGRIAPADILAIVRREAMGEMAMDFGADSWVFGENPDVGQPEVLIECSGNPAAFERALEITGRELHLKSTHGQGAGGIARLTELVVDELAIARLDERLRLPGSPIGLVRTRLGKACPLDETSIEDIEPGVFDLDDRIVAGSDAALDLAIRPRPHIEQPIVAPRSTIYLDWRGEFRGGIARAVLDRGLRITSSRCGDFRRTMALLARDPELRGLGARMVSHRFPRAKLGEALRVAASPEALKVVVS